MSQTADTTYAPGLLVYLFAEELVPTARLDAYRIPGKEAKLEGWKLVSTILAASLWHLREEGALSLEVTTRKSMFVFTKTEVLATRQTNTGREGLEGALLACIDGRTSVDTIVYRWLGKDSIAPWREALKVVNAEAVDAGLLLSVDAERSKVGALIKGSTTLEPNADKIAEVEPEARELIARLKQFAADEPELYTRLLEKCHHGLFSRKESDNDN